MTTPRIDLIVPVRDAAAWLPDLLHSVRQLPFTSWRTFIVDDGSRDGTYTIARRYANSDERITVEAIPPSGVGAARNRGLLLATAHLVGFLDADDVIEPAGYAALIDAIEASGADLATGQAWNETSRGLEPYWSQDSDLFKTRRTVDGLRQEPRLIGDHTTWNKVFRRKFLLEHDLWFSQSHNLGEDALHSIAAYTAATRVDIVPIPVYRHRVRPGSLGSHIREESGIRDWLDYAELALDALRGEDAAVVTVWRRRLLRHEAWTRARRFHEIRDPGLRERLAAFIRNALDDERWPPGKVELDPAQRWTYDLIARPATRVTLRRSGRRRGLIIADAEGDPKPLVAVRVGEPTTIVRTIGPTPARLSSRVLDQPGRWLIGVSPDGPAIPLATPVEVPRSSRLDRVAVTSAPHDPFMIEVRPSLWRRVFRRLAYLISRIRGRA